MVIEVMIYGVALLFALAFVVAGLVAYFKRNSGDAAYIFCTVGLIILFGVVCTYFDRHPNNTNKNVPIQTSTETQSKK